MYNCTKNDIGYGQSKEHNPAEDKYDVTKTMYRVYPTPYPSELARSRILAPQKDDNSVDILDSAYDTCEWLSMENHEIDNHISNEEFKKLRDARLSHVLRENITYNLDSKKIPKKISSLMVAQSLKIINSTDIKKYARKEKKQGILEVGNNTSRDDQGRYTFSIDRLYNVDSIGTFIFKQEEVPSEIPTLDKNAAFPQRIFQIEGKDIVVPLGVAKSKRDDIWSRWVNEDYLYRQRAREIINQEHRESERLRSMQAAMQIQADARARAILFDHLNPDQQRHWIDSKEFMANINGKLWKFTYGTHGNVFHMHDSGLYPITRFCIAPVSPHNGGILPVEDVILAQILLIQADEQEFRRIANSTNVLELRLAAA